MCADHYHYVHYIVVEQHDEDVCAPSGPLRVNLPLDISVSLCYHAHELPSLFPAWKYRQTAAAPQSKGCRYSVSFLPRYPLLYSPATAPIMERS